MDDTKQPPENPLDIASGTARESDIEWQKLELDKERLRLEIRKERTAKLQLILPIVVSLVAITFGAFSEYVRSRQAERLQEAQYFLRRMELERKDGRLELFKKLTEPGINKEAVLATYAEMFPQDAREIVNNQERYRPTPAPSSPTSSPIK